MPNPVASLGNLKPVSFPTTADGLTGASPNVGELNFQQLLLESLQQVTAMQKTANSNVAEQMTGGDLTQVEVLTAVKKADLALRMMLQIRNKVLEAYQEIQQLRM